MRHVPTSLNLRQSIVTELWSQRDPHMAMILQWMEGMEYWVLDDEKGFSEALLLLVPRLERASRDAMLDNADGLLKVMAYMSCSRALRILLWADEHFPKGLSIELVELAREERDDPRAQLLLDRLRALQSLSLLPKVFAPARMRLIASLLRETDDDQSTVPPEGRGRF